MGEGRDMWEAAPPERGRRLRLTVGPAALWAAGPTRI